MRAAKSIAAAATTPIAARAAACRPTEPVTPVGFFERGVDFFARTVFLIRIGVLLGDNVSWAGKSNRGARARVAR